MLKSSMLVGAALLAVALAQPAQAQTTYPWCSEYGGHMGGSSNCGFSTYEQCMANVSGIGGFCRRNPFYNGPAARPVRKKRDS